MVNPTLVNDCRIVENLIDLKQTTNQSLNHVPQPRLISIDYSLSLRRKAIFGRQHHKLLGIKTGRRSVFGKVTHSWQGLASMRACLAFWEQRRKEHQNYKNTLFFPKVCLSCLTLSSSFRACKSKGSSCCVSGRGNWSMSRSCRIWKWGQHQRGY